MPLDRSPALARLLRPSRFALCLVVALLAAAAAPAADDGDDGLIELRFGGGTVDEYVTAIRRVAADANIIVMTAASRATVPPVELRGVSVATALAILDDTVQQTETEIVALSVVEHEPEHRVVEGGPNPVRRAHGAPAYSIQAEVRRLGGRAAGAPDASRIIAVGEVLEGVSPEALLTAVETALELIGDDVPPARLRFHEDTGLLIARGHPEQMVAIAEVVENAMRGVHQRSGARQRRLEREALQTQMQDTRVALDAARERGAMLQHEVVVLQTRSEILQRELEETQARLVDVQRMNDELKQRAHALEMELARARESKERKE